MTNTETNSIGIDKNKANELASKLNNLLANYQIFYQNLRGLHWNIKGQNFFELHVKFEELYNDAVIKVDEIAERILTLDSTPLHSYTDYIKLSEIETTGLIKDGIKGVEITKQSFTILLKLERAILELASESNDEGTNSLMSDYIKEQEKTVWMLSAYLD